MTKKKMTLDNLAGMMQNEFLDMKKEMHLTINEATNKVEKKLSSKINGLKSESKDIKSDTSQILRQQKAEVDRDDRQDLKIKDHETRIVVLEKDKELV